MPSKLDAAIVLMGLATGVMGLEERNRAEIALPAPAVAPVAKSAPRPCAAAAEYQDYAMRRMTLMAFGIAVPERPPGGRRFPSAAIGCESR
jgi:hypothetical protein